MATNRPLLALLPFVLLSSGPTSAATVITNEQLPASSACQGSLPQFAGTLRARPQAIANEGTVTAFVTCGANGGVPSRKVSMYGLSVVNRGDSAQIATCTGVDGPLLVTAPRVYATRTFNLAAGARLLAFFLPESFGQTSIVRVQFNCSLPPSMEIAEVHVQAETIVQP